MKAMEHQASCGLIDSPTVIRGTNVKHFLSSLSIAVLINAVAASGTAPSGSQWGYSEVELQVLFRSSKRDNAEIYLRLPRYLHGQVQLAVRQASYS